MEETITFTRQEILVMVRDAIVSDRGVYDQRSYIHSEVGTLRDAATVRAHVQAVLADHDPHRNVCGTTGCVAGLTAIFAAPDGAKFATTTMRAVNPSDHYWVIHFPGGGWEEIRYYAEKTLGLQWDSANYLFSENRTVDEVVDALDALIADPNADIIPDGYNPDDD